MPQEGLGGGFNPQGSTPDFKGMIKGFFAV